MGVTLRLTRNGGKKNPFYRLVAADSRSPRDGRFIEQIGIYDPLKNPPVVRFKTARVEHWLSKGAVPGVSTVTARATGADPSLLPFGRLGRPHGLKGDLALRPFNPDASELARLKLPVTVTLLGPAGRSEKTLQAIRPAGDHFLVRF